MATNKNMTKLSLINHPFQKAKYNDKYGIGNDVGYKAIKYAMDHDKETFKSPYFHSFDSRNNKVYRKGPIHTGYMTDFDTWEENGYSSGGSFHVNSDGSTYYEPTLNTNYIKRKMNDNDAYKEIYSSLKKKDRERILNNYMNRKKLKESFLEGYYDALNDIY